MANKRTKGRYVVVKQDGARIEDDWRRKKKDAAGVFTMAGAGGGLMKRYRR